ncbi:hypothetical protein B296_00007044 [Ensete ventricosum]|uniref:Uncharacterized protein n=1 Tax=Ensete ventricosum TaxID=4639 RepID=A0A427B3N5_ENSVE|nr:hypothetical protein B296_00007044 [Ensete ventricosum]
MSSPSTSAHGRPSSRVGVAPIGVCPWGIAALIAGWSRLAAHVGGLAMGSHPYMRPTCKWLPLRPQATFLWALCSLQERVE